MFWIITVKNKERGRREKKYLIAENFSEALEKSLSIYSGELISIEWPAKQNKKGDSYHVQLS